MAVTIDWATAVININQVDMVLIQSSPTIVYQLDMEPLRLTLKDLEDDLQGINWPVTHSRNAPVTISGAVLAQVIEILPPYTISFEETGTPYRVNVVGANTNIGERINLLSGEVSVSTSNSAGLQDLNSLQAASFGGAVAIDPNSSFTGTTFPIGTRGTPVNNLSDAVSIAQTRGLHTIQLLDDLTITTEDISSGYLIRGDSTIKNTLTVNAGSSVSNCEFENLTIQGTLDNDNTVKRCKVLNLTHVNGKVFECTISGKITLDGGSRLDLQNCFSGVAGGAVTQTAEVDMGGSGQSLTVRNYSGGLKLSNRTGTDAVSMDMLSGQVVIDSTVTAGEITVRGIARLTNNGTGTSTVNTDALLNLTNIADEVDALTLKKFLAFK